MTHRQTMQSFVAAFLLAIGLGVASSWGAIPLGASGGKPPADGADLSVTISDSPDPVAVGGQITYTIKVSNAGPVTATGVMATDALPESLSFVSSTSTQGSCTGTSTITCNLGNLAKRGSATVTISANTTRSGTVTNIASVTADQSDPKTSNNSASTSTNVQPPETDLSVLVTDTADPVTVGETFHYQVEVHNPGPPDAPDVVATVTPPAGLTLLSTSIDCSGTNVLTCPVGTLPPKSWGYVMLHMRAEQLGDFTASASVSGAVSDPNRSNDSDSETTTVEEVTGPDLAVTLTDSPDPVQIPNAVTYSMEVSNVGAAHATPAQLLFWAQHAHIFGIGTYESVDAGRGSCTDVSPIAPTEGVPGSLPPVSGVPRGQRAILCDFGTIAPGETIPVTVTVRLLWPSSDKESEAWIVRGEARVGHVSGNLWLQDPGSNSAALELTRVTTGSDDLDCVLGGNRAFIDVLGAVACAQ